VECEETGVENMNVIDVANGNEPRKLLHLIHILPADILCTAAVM
jgi:hypothetical protein